MHGLILFDIDGTLLKPGDPAHQRALLDAMQRVYGVDGTLDGVPLGGMLDSQIVRLALERHGFTAGEVAEGLPELMQAMAARYRELIDGDERRSWLLPGVTSLLDRLAGDYLLTVLTGNASGVARAKLEAAGIVGYFPIGAYGDSAEHRHELVGVVGEKAAERHRMTWQPESVVIVGDTPRDIEAARNSGVRVIAVATGRYTVENLREHNPDAVFPDLGETEAVQDTLRRLTRG